MKYAVLRRNVQTSYKNAHTHTKVENLILLEASCKKNAWYFP